MRQRSASLPGSQYHDLCRAESKRRWATYPNSWSCTYAPEGHPVDIAAKAAVKEAWIKQGIWNPEWDGRCNGWVRWKHEKPLVCESESEIDPEVELSPPTRGLFGNLTPSTRPRARRPKSEAERQRIRERRVVRERDRQASGPIYQFLHQVSQERDRVREEWTSDDAVPLESINTKCYTAVRQSWKSRGIWIDQWDVLPGDRWMHESPLGPTVAGFALGYSLENGQPRMSDESQPLPSEQLPPSTAFGGENDQLGFRTQPEPEPTDSRNLDLDESRRRNVGPEPPASHLHQSTADRPHVSAQRSRREVSNVRSVFLPTLHTSKITKAPKRKQSRRSRRLGGPSHPPADPQPSKVATTTAGPRTSDAKAAPRQSQRLKEQKTKKDAGRMRAATKQPRVPQDRARSDRTAPKASKPQGITKATRRKATKTR